MDQRSIGDLLVSFFNHRSSECLIMFLFEEVFPLIPRRFKKKKELYKLNGSHWSSPTHAVKKLPQRREQQKLRLECCGASKQTFFFFFLLQNNLPSFIWQECSCVKPYISQVEKITWIILLANKSVI